MTREVWRNEHLQRLTDKRLTDKRLTDKLTDLDTEPAISDKILQCIRSWLANTQPDIQCDQVTIGIHLLHRGLIGIDWNYRQQSYYKSQGTHQSGHHWSRDLILFSWDEARVLWDTHNKEIHDPATEPQHLDNVQQVEALYEQEQHVLAVDRSSMGYTQQGDT